MTINCVFFSLSYNIIIEMNRNFNWEPIWSKWLWNKIVLHLLGYVLIFCRRLLHFTHERCWSVFLLFLKKSQHLEKQISFANIHTQRKNVCVYMCTYTSKRLLTDFPYFVSSWNELTEIRSAFLIYHPLSPR